MYLPRVPSSIQREAVREHPALHPALQQGVPRVRRGLCDIHIGQSAVHDGCDDFEDIFHLRGRVTIAATRTPSRTNLVLLLKNHRPMPWEGLRPFDDEHVGKPGHGAPAEGGPATFTREVVLHGAGVDAAAADG